MKPETFHVWFPTRNRPVECLDLLRDVDRESRRIGEDGGRVLVTVIDDASDQDYSAVREYCGVRDGWEYRRADEWHGKERFWQLMDGIHQSLRKSPARYFVQLADDFRLCRDFFRRMAAIWKALPRDKIALNPLNDCIREGSACWNGKVPTRATAAANRVGWIDCTQFSERAYYEALGWRFPQPSQYTTGTRKGSGVGCAISNHLALMGHPGAIYQVQQSHVVHRITRSQMHAVLGGGRIAGLTAAHYVDGPDEHRRLLFGDTVTVSICSIPHREPALRLCVASLLPQVDRVNVMLNGYDHVPAFLKHPKIVIERSQVVGDYRSDAKFWWAAITQGYHIFADDDLSYAPDFVMTIVAWCECYGRKAAVGLHGARLMPPITDYYKSRRVFHGMGEVSGAQWVHVVGTGAMGFHSDTIRLSREKTCHRPVANEREHNMSDIVFALECKRQGVPSLVAKHRAGMMCQEIVDAGIFERSRNRDGSAWDSAQIQGRAVTEAAPWPLWQVNLATLQIELVAQPDEQIAPRPKVVMGSAMRPHRRR